MTDPCLHLESILLKELRLGKDIINVAVDLLHELPWLLLLVGLHVNQHLSAPVRAKLWVQAHGITSVTAVLALLASVETFPLRESIWTLTQLNQLLHGEHEGANKIVTANGLVIETENEAVGEHGHLHGYQELLLELDLLLDHGNHIGLEGMTALVLTLDIAF